MPLESGKVRELVLQMCRFVLAGLVNTGVGLAFVYINIYGFGMGQLWGNFTGYVLGLFLAFSLHRSWTFRSRNSISQGLIKYLFAFAIAYGMNLVCVVFFQRMGVHPAIAQATGVVPYVITFFVLSRYVVFAESKRS